jgi:hypothetical protein
MRLNVYATIGTLIGFAIALWIAGPFSIIPMLAAIVLYNLPKHPKKKIAK